MTTAGFEGRARLSSGSTPAPAMLPYRVGIAGGLLSLASEREGVVLQVSVDRVHARRLGRAGSVLVELDASPLVLTFSGVGSATPLSGALGRVRRLVDAGRGRRHRGRFLRTLRRARP